MITAADVSKATPARTGTTSTLNGIKCDYAYTSSSSLVNSLVAGLLSTTSLTHRVICVDGGSVTLPSSLSNVTVIAKGDVTFSAGATPTLNRSTVISREGSVNFGSNKKAVIQDSKVFSQGNLDLSGDSTVSGVSTIASGGDISMGGAANFVSTNGTAGIGAAFIAEGNFDLRGATSWYAEVRVGGNFTKSGTIKEMYGSIEAKGDINISGNVTLDTGMPIMNADVLPKVPTVLSRR